MLGRLIIKGEGTKMMRLANADGKEWLLPLQHLCTGLMLYQPSGWKGLWLKRLLPVVGRWQTVRKMIHADTQEMRLSPTLTTAIGEAFATEHYDFALFGGTPGVHQKVTIQVQQGERIMGYVKVTDQPAVAENFAREARLLHDLKEKGLTGIPEALACGQTADGLHFFAQSTAKSRQSTYPHQWTALHDEFLDMLHATTKISMPYEQTDLCKAIQQLKNRIGWLDQRHQHIVAEAIGLLEQHFGGTTQEWSAYHADFTPWNMFVEQGRLYVFDWEYALRSCVPGIDRYHFLTQTLIFEKHRSADEIYEFFGKNLADSCKIHYLCYLLVTIATYVGRESTPEGVGSIAMMDSWTVWLHRLLSGT